MKIRYDSKEPKAKARDFFEKINDVLADLFVAQGYRLTVRQLFYQLVARGVVENCPAGSSYVERLCRDGRMCGYIDWDAIEDRLRDIVIPADHRSVKIILNSVAKYFRLDRQKYQNQHIEIWVEKDAVSQIIEPVADKYGIPFLCGRGQFSVSCLKESADRWLRDDRMVHLLYLGDHDPSGILGIEGNIRRKMQTMTADAAQFRGLFIERVAIPLKWNKLNQLPGVPVKPGDANTPKYRELYGDMGWELESLTPKQLIGFVEKALKKVMDFDTYNQVLEEEEDGRLRLGELAKAEETEA